MRVAVVGLGGVGGYIAANLTKTEHEVVGFARGEHLVKIQEQGIKIVEDENSWSVKLDARELNAADGIFDTVLFCVKSYDLQEAYAKIAPHINAESILLSFSNGVSNGDTLRGLSQSIVLDGCVYILSHQEEAGVIHKKGKVFAAVFGGDVNAAHALAQVFEDAGLRFKAPVDIQKEIWKKYIFIAAFATLTTYYDKSIRFVYENYEEETELLLNEIASVAEAKGVDVFDEVQKSLETASKLPKDASTSMHLDFQNKKRNELQTLSGYIVEEAQKLKVQTPLMQKIYEALRLKDCSI
ncbi:2-dehydropantoate 2-reductase [bacterium]|jgi:2-dehydropantoate 2-reductase|nr:2-dehydropantoate 2-reductase [bacterium]MBU1433521.1 2-dehydropantoate 2-reductase [bacterium]MBU1503297.1 2-dehydropantoate 2-reductase [bacterium]